MAVEQANARDRDLRVDQLRVSVHSDEPEATRMAAREATRLIQQRLEEQPRVRMILATGNTQLKFLAQLTHPEAAIDWSRLELFHMDEYWGLPSSHASSFQSYLRRHVLERITPRAFHFINGETGDSRAECRRYAALLQAAPVDLCFLGVGNNGHLAFNEPSLADFEDPEAVKVVDLDPATQAQQSGQGHFDSPDQVPRQALTLTIPTLMSSRNLVCLALGSHKAAIVREMLGSPVACRCPASIIRRHPRACLYLDAPAAAELKSTL